MKKLFTIFSIMGAISFIFSIFMMIKINKMVINEKKSAVTNIINKIEKKSDSSLSDADLLIARNNALRKQLDALRMRVENLENVTANLNETQKKQIANTTNSSQKLENTDFATQRRIEAKQRDLQNYTPEELKKIEDSYGKAIKSIKTPEGQKKLLELYKKYPESNRGGCAAMNLAVELQKEGKTADSKKLLDSIIENESQSVFGNGVKILPKAIFSRAKIAKKEGDDETFNSLKETLEKKYPKEIDNNSKTFSSMLEEESTK